MLFVGGCSSSSDAPSSGTFDALTYNVHGLPSVITGDDTPARMQAIAPHLPAFNIIGLQEDFDDTNHALLTANSEHIANVRFAEVVDSDRVYGSGLSVLADYPVVDFKHEHFNDCFGILENSSDCLASKGFQVVRLQLGPDESHTLDVYNSHLEAGGGDGDTLARDGQVTQLITALTGYSEGRAVVLLADTNMRDTDPADRPLLERLFTETDLLELCVEVNCLQPGRIDRILFRSSDAMDLNAEQWWVDERFVSDDNQPLSDHDAIAGTFTWSIRLI